MANDIGNKKSVSAVIARETLGSLVRDVWKNRTEIILTVRGKPRAKIVPIDYENEDCTNKNIENRKLIDIVDDLKAGKVFATEDEDKCKIYAFYWNSKFMFTSFEGNSLVGGGIPFNSLDDIPDDNWKKQCRWVPYVRDA